MTNPSPTALITLAAAIHKRTSVRAYTGQPLSADHRAALENAAESAPRLAGAAVRFTFVTEPAQVNRLLRGLVGNYGKVKDAPALLLGIAQQGPYAAQGLGFTMEHLVLEATRCGIGTCWNSGMFDRRLAAEIARLAPDENVLAVSPLGYAAPGKENGLVKSLVGANKRKALRDIVYAGQWGSDSTAYLDSHPRHRHIAEAVRWAPSAMNRQPWRLIFTASMLVLVSVAANSALDDGIALAHVSISAQEQGMPGTWELDIDRAALRASLQLPPPAHPTGSYPLAQ